MSGTELPFGHGKPYDPRSPPTLMRASIPQEYEGSHARRTSELSGLKRDHDLKKADVIVLVMGPTGAGKSRFIKEATGADVYVSDSLQPGTSKVEAYHFSFREQHVALVDTPGFDDTNRPDAAVFRELAAWLVARYQEQTRLTAVVYVQPITATRVSGSVLRNFAVMKRMLGMQNFPHLTLVTSMWDLIRKEDGERRERELRTDFWSDLISSGAKVARFRGNRKSAFEVLAAIKPDNGLSSLTIQHEIIDQGLSLDHTTAGTYLDQEIIGLLGRVSRRQQIPQSPRSAPLHDELLDLAQIGKRRELKASWDVDYGSLWLDDPAPEPDISPEVYRALRDDEFRLIELRAGSGSTPLEVSLAVEALSKSSNYSALSYAVGQNKPPVGINLRHGRSIFRFEISKNLHTALSRLRRRNIDILIWVDALSINPRDDRERAQQIRKMSEIFSRAQNVCIWLGEAEKDDENDKAMKFARRVLDLTAFEKALGNKAQTANFLVLAKLMASPWFQRRWCVQEILMATQATVHCGVHVMRWSDFVDVAMLLKSRWEVIQDKIDVSTSHIAGDTHLVDAMALIDASQSMIRKARNGHIVERLLDLEVLLSRLATFEVTPPHDTVYAIYDLARDLAGTKKLRIDYSVEPRELFREVTELVVMTNGSLDIICRPWAPLVALPSWIPTVAKLPYQRRRFGFQFDRVGGAVLVNMPGSHRYQACGSCSAKGNVSFSTGDQPILEIRGLEVGSVDELGGQCLNGIIPEAWMALTHWQDLHKEMAPDSFWRTIVADQGPQGAKAPNWYRRACENAFRESRTPHIDTGRLNELSRSSNVKEFLSKVQDIVWSRNLAKVALTESCGSFASIRSGDGPAHAVCLCPAATKVGDVVCILYGCSVPVILRKQASVYVLIGEGFVDGLMDGEAMQPPSGASKDNSRVFKIV